MNLKTIFQQQEWSSILRVKHKLGTQTRRERDPPWAKFVNLQDIDRCYLVGQ